MMRICNALLVSALGAALVGAPLGAGAQQATGDKIGDKIDQKKEQTKDRIGRGMDRDQMTGDRPAGATRSDDVRDLQQALKERGHDPGPIDGMIGPQTRAALIDFQKAENLTETGRLDEETASRLNLDGMSTGPRR